jgi:restriction system protein
MDFLEYPLLHAADLMLTVLKVGEAGDADLNAALARLQADLEKAKENPPVGRDEMAARLATARLHLGKAGLIEERPESRFRITERGRRALAQHPDGIDETVLMLYPEFRKYLRARVEHAEPEDAAIGAFTEGHAAQLEGRPHFANPYRQDTAAHLSWETGWFTARDEMREHRRSGRG